jgi:hypothetical protein
MVGWTYRLAEDEVDAGEEDRKVDVEAGFCGRVI